MRYESSRARRAAPPVDGRDLRHQGECEHGFPHARPSLLPRGLARDGSPPARLEPEASEQILDVDQERRALDGFVGFWCPEVVSAACVFPLQPIFSPTT